MKYLFVLFVSFICHTALAQWAIPQQMRAENTLDRLSDKDGLGKGDILYGIPLPPGGVRGNNYLDDNWNIASLMLFESEKMVEGYKMKYDIKENAIEVKTSKDVKMIEGEKVKNLTWRTKDSVVHYFVNAKDYTLDNTKLSGFLEVIVDGPTPLFKRTVVNERESTYIAAFDVGDRDRKISKKEIFYYSNNGQLFKITNKKSLLPAFGEHAEDVGRYIKINQLDIAKQRGLSLAFDYFNTKNGSSTK